MEPMFRAALPAMVVMMPVAASILRMRLLKVSAR